MKALRSHTYVGWWSDKRGRHLINFLVNSPEGPPFLESIDASSEIQDAFRLLICWRRELMRLGKTRWFKLSLTMGQTTRQLVGS
jgi:hypothetical protein